MKRQLEQCESGTEFFCLDEAIEILLSHVTSVRFLAQLIQLSKRVRRQVWNFLSDPEKWTTAWLSQFCGDLYQYRERHNYDTLEMWPLDPIFWQSRNGYCLGRVQNNESLMLATVYHIREGRDTFSYPGWEIAPLPKPITLLFNWYFVARALVLGWDTRILNHNRHCWHQQNVPSRDADLCLL